jgi:alkanesulfonate monooxygenase SsuD/methylene tetrahydromethanopterin reductase-like flavin-dependent oxidoreductase (luciferase family)
MEVGLGLSFSNIASGMTDSEVYAGELALAAAAEDAGFDSIWTPEHHFDGYMMTPNVPQFLSWVAGQTKRIKLGTMVMVLPWHDPVRVAESFILLDHMSEGRAILGIGRGLGKNEFEGFGLDISESRGRFREYAGAIINALETGVMECDGQYLKQTRVELRPRPYKSFRGRVYASAVSPESIKLMTELDVGLLVIAQKPWDKVTGDLVTYRQGFLNANGTPPAKPIFAVFVGVSEDPAMVERMRSQYLQAYARSTTDFYGFDDPSYAQLEGYEYYGDLARNIAKHGVEKFNGFLADLQVWGSPEEVTAKLQEMVRRFDIGSFIVFTQFGGMPLTIGRANFNLFVEKVMPHLKAIDVTAQDGPQPVLAA